MVCFFFFEIHNVLLRLHWNGNSVGSRLFDDSVSGKNIFVVLKVYFCFQRIC